MVSIRMLLIERADRHMYVAETPKGQRVHIDLSYVSAMIVHDGRPDLGKPPVEFRYPRSLAVSAKIIHLMFEGSCT